MDSRKNRWRSAELNWLVKLKTPDWSNWSVLTCDHVTESEALFVVQIHYAQVT